MLSNILHSTQKDRNQCHPPISYSFVPCFPNWYLEHCKKPTDMYNECNAKGQAFLKYIKLRVGRSSISLHLQSGLHCITQAKHLNIGSISLLRNSFCEQSLATETRAKLHTYTTPRIRGHHNEYKRPHCATPHATSGTAVLHMLQMSPDTVLMFSVHHVPPRTTILTLAVVNA